MTVLQFDNFWINKEEWDALKNWRADREVELAKHMREWHMKNKTEGFYYVNLANSDDTIHTLGMKSRLTGKIYLTKDYEIDKDQPIENTDYHYVRDSTSFDI